MAARRVRRRAHPSRHRRRFHQALCDGDGVRPEPGVVAHGHYPSLHGVSQTDGLGKAVDSADMFWLSPDTVPTMGDWFRAGAIGRSSRGSGTPRT